MKNKILAVCVAVLSVFPCGAQEYSPPGQGRNWRFFLAGGYPQPLGVAHHWTNGQYSISGGFTYQEPDWPMGLQFDGMTHHFGFNSAAEDFARSEGYMQVTAGTANVTWAPKLEASDRFSPRLLAGLGVYNRVLRTTDVRLTTGTCVDPWWGYYPCAGTGTVITSSNSQTKLGFNVGTTLDWALQSVDMFLSLRFHMALTSNEETMFLPIELGIRW